MLPFMCGRFALNTSKSALLDWFKLMNLDADFWEFAPRFNIAPTQFLLAVRQGDKGRELARLRWGLVPSWAKDDKSAAKMINARSETVGEKPSFRNAFKKRRCLIPASGFYEWERSGKTKKPYYFQPRQGLFAFAGIWESWQPPEGAALETCSMLTTGPNELMAPIHDRTPVLVAPEHYERWLDVEHHKPESLADLLQPFPADRMACHAVSVRVNNARNEGPDLVAPVAPDTLF